MPQYLPCRNLFDNECLGEAYSQVSHGNILTKCFLVGEVGWFWSGCVRRINFVIVKFVCANCLLISIHWQNLHLISDEQKENLDSRMHHYTHL